MGKKTLDPIAIALDDPVFNAITAWKFGDDFVSRMLIDDIPQRVKYEAARLWAYRDPQNNIVGFGTLTLSDDCSQFTNGRPHTYIPLLAVHPELRGLGHGRSIVEHLVAEAADLVAAADTNGIHDALFLDVYEDSIGAIKLYQKCGFITPGGALVDPLNGKNFYVMAKRVSRS